MSAAAPDLSKVPAELLVLPQWVVWRSVTRNGKCTKPPYCAATGRKAACDDPRTWGTFDRVIAACANGRRCRFDGPGFVLTEQAGYAVVDLDHCRNPETGEIEQWAQDIVTALASYTEVSPSGGGLHIWVKGKLPAGGRRKGRVEMYDTGRYLTITGRHLDGTPVTIEDRQQELEALHARVFGNGAARGPQQDGGGEQPQGAEVDQAPPAADQSQAAAEDAAPAGLTDGELLDRAVKSVNRKGESRFARLWCGEWEGRYRSASEASLALCRQLAFWTGKDASRIDRLFRQSALYSDKWEREDYRGHTIAKAIECTTQVYGPPAPPPTRTQGEEGRVGDFEVGDAGVFRVVDDKRFWICSRLDVVAVTRTADGGEWGRLLVFKDLDGKEHSWAMPMGLTSGDGAEYRAHLLAEGLRMHPGRGSRDALTTYVQSEPAARVRCVSRVGWCGGAFVLPDATIGPSDSERVIFQTLRGGEQHFRIAGTLEEWRRHVALPCRGNDLLLFAASTAFAAPLLALVGEDGGGFHYRGASSIGKSTGQTVAGSVWGGGGRSGFLHTWRATANGLEAIAEAHNDALLCLDEFAQIDPKEAGDVAYLLAGGQGKLRMTRTSTLRQGATWRLLFISSGEIGLAEHIATTGKRVRAGQGVRMIDIAADVGSGLGLFNEIHGADTPDLFARQLRAAACTYYGTAIRAFLEKLIINTAAAVQSVKAERAPFTKYYVSSGVSGEVSRVAGLFSLVAAAGELAIGMGIVPWKKGEAEAASANCFLRWVEGRGTGGPADTEAAVRQVRRFLELHGASRFQRRGTDIVPNRAGFRTADEYLVLPEVFRCDVCQGYDSAMVAKALRDRGHLITKGKGHLTVLRRLPGYGTDATRVYAIRTSLPQGESDV